MKINKSIQFNKKDLCKSIDHVQNAIDIFGTTFYTTRAGFILTNGKMLDLTYGGNAREDHRVISDAMPDLDFESNSDYLIAFMNEGNIRCIPELPGVDLAKQPNERQIKVLESYVEFWIMKKKSFIVQISDANGNQIWGQEYTGFTPTKKIISDINSYFLGELNESLNEVYPQKGESKSDFINRFMRATAKEYPDVKQRYAVAYSYWNRRNLKETVQNDDIFNINKTGVGKYDEWLSSQSARDRDNVNLEFKYMTPREYFEACGHLFGNNFNSQLRQIEGDKNINKELDKVYDSDQKMNLTLLDYVSDPPTQEGRHRMYVLAQKYGWDEESYPVAIFTAKDETLADKKKADAKYDKLFKQLERCIEKAYDFTYRDLDELKQQIDFYLDDYIDNPNVKIKEIGNRLIISQDNVDYEINKNEFDWDESKPTWDDISLDDVLDINDLEEAIDINSKTDFIINPEDNQELAAKLQPIIAKYKNTVPMKRDNCAWINTGLKYYLEEHGYKVSLVSGYFIVDNLNIADTQDLKCLKSYDKYKTAGKTIPEFIIDNNYLGQERGWFTYMPHWWLELDGLIIDRAWPMFKKALEKPITAENYTTKDFNESLKLTEATRGELIAKSRNADLYKNKEFGKNRFERKKLSKIANQVKSFNQIDMNKFFKQDILEVNIPVVGETDTYNVTISLEGVCAEIARNIKINNNKFEFKVVFQAIAKIFNSSNKVKVKCTCDDFKYRYAHAMIQKGNSVDGTDKDPGPGKTGMANTQGEGCKHILAVLNNASWLQKVASCLRNYINYSQEHIQKAFMKLIFPKLYGMPADAAIENDLVPEDTNLDTEKHIIDVINDWAKNRGKFKKGENKNPVTGTGGRSKKV